MSNSPASFEEVERAWNEPIAVIGMACRFPGGAHTPEQLWSLLEQGQEAVSAIPADRWPARDGFDPITGASGKTGLFRLIQADVQGFDPEVFGLTGPQAQSIDPSHRLLLEVAWEAFENAGIDGTDLPGSQTGVFLGISNFTDAHAGLQAPDAVRSGASSMTGFDSSAAPGCLSSVLGLEGPSLAVDTACSSSLVAVHLACQSLLLGESRLALTGGLDLIPAPEIAAGLAGNNSHSSWGCRQGVDASADDYIRGEGCGLLVLQRYCAALQDGHSVLAVIAGSAMNHSGGGPGMPAPNPRPRQNVIRAALRRAGLPASAVQSLEAQGAVSTGLDTAEMQVLADVYGAARTASNPLWVGCVQSDLGRLGAAAGCAGLIKTILQLRHRTLCPRVQLSLTGPGASRPGPPVQIPVQSVDWPSAVLRVAAVNAFGLTGANAHLILREAPPVPDPAASAAQRPIHLLVLSSPGADGLKAVAHQYASFLDQTSENDDPGLGDLCYSAALSRAGFGQRLAAVGRTKAELKSKLDSWLAGPAGAGLWQRAVAPQSPPRLAFLFTGQGSQYRQMGRDLWETQPVFREVLEQCDRILRPGMEVSLLDLVYHPATPDDSLHQTVHTQPVIFAFGYALAKMWESWGVTPAVVLGHSIGEVAAACFAGAIPLPEALNLVALRGRLIHRATQPGLMGAIVAPAETVAAAIRDLGGAVEIAAINAPQNVVISGETGAVRRILEHFKDRDIPSLALRVSHAIHSPLMEPILDEYTAAAARIAFSTPRLPLISNLTGRLAGPEMTRPEYWRRQLRQTVQFRACLETLRDTGCAIALETGGTSILSSMGPQALPGAEMLWLHSLGPKNSLFNMRPQRMAGRNDWETVLDTLGQLYVCGLDLDWKQIESGFAWRRVRLPNYPFQRKSGRMETIFPDVRPL